MKIFNRVLAMLLTLVTVLALLPMSVFADEWLDVDADTSTSGNVTSTDVTVTLDAKALLSYLQDADLVGLLTSGITVDGMRDAFSVEDLYDIIPKEKFTSLIKAIIDDLDVETLISYVDVNALLEDIDRDALISMIKELDNLQDYVTDYDALMSYIDEDDIAAILDPDPVTGKSLIDTDRLIADNITKLVDLAMDSGNLLDIVDVDKLLDVPGVDLAALINMEYIKNTVGYSNLVEKYVDIEGLANSNYLNKTNMETLIKNEIDLSDVNDNYVDIDALEAYVRANYKPAELLDYVIDANLQALAETKTDLLDQYVDDAKLQAMFSGKTYNDLKPYLDVDKLVAKVAGLEYSVLEGYIVDMAKVQDLFLAEIDPSDIVLNADLTVNVGATITNGVVSNDVYNKMVNNGYLNTTAMLVGSNALYTVQDLKADGTVDVQLMLAGDSANGIDALFTVEQLLDEQTGAIDADLVVSGDAANGIDPLFTVPELLNGDVLDTTAMVSGSDPILPIADLIANKLLKVETIVVGDDRNDSDPTNDIPALAGVELLISYNVVDPTQLVREGIVNLDGEGGLTKDYSYENLILMSTLESQLNAVQNKQLLVDCIPDKAAAIKTIGVTKAVNAIGGYEKLLNTYVSDFNGLIEKLGLDSILNEIVADGKLNSIFDVNGLIEAIGVEKLLELVDIKAVAQQFYANGGVQALLKMLNPKDYAGYMAAIVACVENNIDQLVLNGYVVAEADEFSLLTINSNNLIKAIATVVPTLNELANIGSDGVVLTTSLGITYQSEGTGNIPMTKNVTVKIVLDGGVDTVKKVASKLQSLIDKVLDYSYENGTLTLDVTLPSEVASVLKKLLENPTVRDEVLGAYHANITDINEFVNNLTLEQIVAILDKVDSADINNAYNRVLGARYISTVLEYIKEATGRDFTHLDLDDWITKASTLPSLVDICDRIYEITGEDILNRLNNQRLNTAVNYIKEKTGYDFTHLTLEDLELKATALPTMTTICEKIEAVTGVEILSRLPASAQNIFDQEIAEIFSKLVDKASTAFDMKNVLTAAAASEDPVQYLYDAVLDKISTMDRYYVTLKKIVVKALNVILSTSYGQKLNQYTLSDLYEGNGTFGGDVYTEFYPKAWAEKAINKLVSVISNRFGYDLSDVTDYVLSYFSDDAVNLGLDASIRVNGLYRVNYLNEKGNLLYTAYLPVGTDLSMIYSYAPDPEVFTATGYWKDTMTGDVLTTMPAKDLGVTPDGEFVIPPEPIPTYDVTFVSPDGTVVYVVEDVTKGMTLKEYVESKGYTWESFVADLDAHVEYDEHFFYSYNHTWVTLSGAAFDLENEKINSNVTLTWKITEDLHNSALRAAGLVYGEDYIITITDDAYTVTFLKDWSELIRTKLEGKPLELVMENRFVNGWTGSVVMDSAVSAHKISMNAAVLTKLNGADAYDTVSLKYTDAVDLKETFGYQEASYFTVGFYYDSADSETSMTFANGEKITVTVPYAGATVQTSEKMTAVSTITDGVRVDVALDANAGIGTDCVTFDAPHFSEYAVVTKYNLSLNNNYVLVLNGAEKTQTSTTPIASSPIAAGYYAEGESLTCTAPTDVASGLTLVETRYAYGDVSGKLGETFTMPAHAVTLTHVATPAIYHIYFYVDNKLTNTVSYTKFDAAAPQYTELSKLPAGKDGWHWSGLGQNQTELNAMLYNKDLYVFLVKGDGSDTTQVTVNLYENKDAAAPKTSITKSVSAWKAELSTLPTVSSLFDGKVGYWVDANGTKLSEINWNGVLVDGGKIDLYAIFTNRAYIATTGPDIVIVDFDSNVTDAFLNERSATIVAGDRVCVEITYKAGMNTTVTMTDATGVATKLTLEEHKYSDGTSCYYAYFTMPASNVTVEVVYEAKEISYIDENGETKLGHYGDINQFTVTIPCGYALAQNVEGWELVGSTTNANGDLILTYAYTLTAETDESALVKVFEDHLVALKYNLLYIMNGKAYATTSAAEESVASANVHVKGWSAVVSKNLLFASMEFENKEEPSLLALWIVLIVLLVILVIVVLYVLYINGKLKPNFILRFVTWLVSGFFAVCMAVAAAGLAIARFFGYREEDLLAEEEPEAEPEAVPAEESAVAEEAAPVEEETAEEATDVAAEESAEAPADEAVAEENTDEAVAEAADESAEAVAEESAEAATEEVAEEATAEVPAEAAEEVAVTEEAPAEASATEEVAAEDCTEEAAPAEDAVADDATETDDQNDK
ncbi:MAG: hypothetical protein IJW92_08540 [Clostridia bacterium]|nr:hypothetical protein [Clostridia bacterium]